MADFFAISLLSDHVWVSQTFPIYNWDLHVPTFSIHSLRHRIAGAKKACQQKGATHVRPGNACLTMEVAVSQKQTFENKWQLWLKSMTEVERSNIHTGHTLLDHPWLCTGTTAMMGLRNSTWLPRRLVNASRKRAMRRSKGRDPSWRHTTLYMQFFFCMNSLCLYIASSHPHQLHPASLPLRGRWRACHSRRCFQRPWANERADGSWQDCWNCQARGAGKRGHFLCFSWCHFTMKDMALKLFNCFWLFLFWFLPIYWQMKTTLKKFLDSMLQKGGKIRGLIRDLKEGYSENTLMKSWGPQWVLEL